MSSRNMIGIDPGKTGALAVLDAAGVVLEVQAMPLVRSTKGRDEYDVPALVAFVRAHAPCFVIAEKGQPLPRGLGGGAANFQRGFGRGLVEGLCVALGVPYMLVAPQSWQRIMLEGTPGADTKQRSLLAAQRLFPGVSLLPSARARKASDGISDALLLAEYGRRARRERGDVLVLEVGG